MSLGLKTFIAIGNSLRSDDGVAIHLAKQLRAKRPDIQVLEFCAPAPELIDYLKGRQVVVIVDAMDGKKEPGSLMRIQPRRLYRTDLTQSHQNNLYALLELGRRLYPLEMPERMSIFAVQGEDLHSFSTELTETVRRMLPRILDVIEKEFDSGTSMP